MEIKILVCVGFTEDLEKMRIIVDDGRNIKSFNKADDALEFLKNREMFLLRNEKKLLNLYLRKL